MVKIEPAWFVAILWAAFSVGLYLGGVAALSRRSHRK